MQAEHKRIHFKADLLRQCLQLLKEGVLKGIEYNSSTKGKCANDKEIVSINCESEKWDTEVEKDKKVSFDNVTNAG